MVETTKGFDYDGHYKDLIDCFFYHLLKRAIPELYEAVDVSVKPRFLDKEFRDILNTSDPEVHTSPHFVDFLVEVPLKNGEAQWVLFHIEVQGPGGGNIPERMFNYKCLIYAHHRRLPVALAIVTEGHKKEERFFSHRHFGTESLYRYNNLVLADLNDDELQASDNPIDLALYAGKCALQAADEELQKYTYLRKLTDLLTERGWDTNEKRSLMLFISRIINLKDEALRERYGEYRLALDREGKMMSDWYPETMKKLVERQAREEGRTEGREEGMIEMAKTLLARGVAPDIVAQSAGWPMERILPLM